MSWRRQSACQPLQPESARGIQPAFALHQLDDHCRGLVDTARRIRQHLVDQGDRVDPAAEIAVIGHHGDTLQRDTGGLAEVLIGGRGKRAHRHAVKSVGEADDVGAAGDLARELHRRLDRVGAGRPGKLHDIVKAARCQDDLLHRRQERLLGGGVEIEAVRDPVALDVADQRILEDRVVVAVVQRTGPGEEIQVAATGRVPQLRAAGALPHAREGACVGLHAGLAPCEDIGRRFAARVVDREWHGSVLPA